MKNKWLFILAIIGVILGCLAAYFYNIKHKPQPPAFKPVSNPYNQGIYATGILESDQPIGSNINIYPEVPGRVTKIFVTENQKVKPGMPLLKIDDSIQKQVVEQQYLQAESALSVLNQLKAQPRRENLLVSKSQVGSAEANLKTAQDQFTKRLAAYTAAPGAVSKEDLDNARNTVAVAAANLDVANRQYELVKAGAWIYDIRTQEKQYQSLEKAYLSAKALLAKYTITAPSFSRVLSINIAPGGYISPQGTYDTYTGASNIPALVLGNPFLKLNVRCFIDEILTQRLPSPDKIKAQMFIRGTTIWLPLQFVRIQPLVSPKIELSNQKTERVDVRVLPVIFRVQKTKDLRLYPGQLVDVYIGNSK